MYKMTYDSKINLSSDVVSDNRCKVMSTAQVATHGSATIFQ